MESRLIHVTGAHAVFESGSKKDPHCSLLESHGLALDRPLSEQDTSPSTRHGQHSCSKQPGIVITRFESISPQSRRGGDILFGTSDIMSLIHKPDLVGCKSIKICPLLEVSEGVSAPPSNQNELFEVGNAFREMRHGEGDQQRKCSLRDICS